MLTAFKNLMGLGPQIDLGQLIANNAIIVDVRSKEEYKDGHIKGSLNIPLQNLNTQLSKLKKNKTIITCCASGARSSVAKDFLKSHGYSEVHNGGSWMKLRQYQ